MIVKKWVCYIDIFTLGKIVTWIETNYTKSEIEQMFYTEYSLDFTNCKIFIYDENLYLTLKLMYGEKLSNGFPVV